MFAQFIQVIYYQLKYGLKSHRKDTGAAAKGVTALLDESWLSSDSFLHRLCKVILWTSRHSHAHLSVINFELFENSITKSTGKILFPVKGCQFVDILSWFFVDIFC